MAEPAERALSGDLLGRRFNLARTTPVILPMRGSRSAAQPNAMDDWMAPVGIDIETGLGA